MFHNLAHREELATVKLDNISLHLPMYLKFQISQQMKHLTNINCNKDRWWIEQKQLNYIQSILTNKILKQQKMKPSWLLSILVSTLLVRPGTQTDLRYSAVCSLTIKQVSPCSTPWWIATGHTSEITDFSFQPFNKYHLFIRGQICRQLWKSSMKQLRRPACFTTVSFKLQKGIFFLKREIKAIPW